MPDEDGIETAAGELYIHWQCPMCNEYNETEGDINGDETECEHCQHVSIVRVM